MKLEKGTVSSVIKVLKENQDNDYFSCVAITGQVRLGKSNLAHQIAKGTYPGFSYEKNYIGNPQHSETFSSLSTSPPRSTVWLDEAAKVLSSERRFDKEQWYLQQLFNQFASHNKIVLLCTPTFLEIDPRWRRSHITIWIHLFKRGKAVIMRNRFLQSSLDSWGLRNMQEREMTMRADELSEERILSNFDNNPSALFYFDFQDWEPEEKKVYEGYKQASQAQLNREHEKFRKMSQLFSEQTRAEWGLARVATYLNWKYSIPFKDIATLAGFSHDKIQEDNQKFIEKVADGTFDETNLPKRYFNKDFFMFAKNTIEQKNKL